MTMRQLRAVGLGPAGLAAACWQIPHCVVAPEPLLAIGGDGKHPGAVLARRGHAGRAERGRHGDRHIGRWYGFSCSWRPAA